MIPEFRIAFICTLTLLQLALSLLQYRDKLFLLVYQRKILNYALIFGITYLLGITL